MVFGKSSKSIYIVKKGDNLSKISQRYSTSIGKIQKWNNIKNPNNIHVGKRLLMYHTEKRTKQRSTIQNKTPKFYQPVQNAAIMKHYQSQGDDKILGTIYHYSSQNIYPAAEGIIIEKGYLRGYGKYIVIDHGRGWLTMYSLLDTIFLEKNEHVTRNSRLGTSKKRRLFFSLSYKGKPVNPILHLQQSQGHTIG